MCLGRNIFLTSTAVRNCLQVYWKMGKIARVKELQNGNEKRKGKLS